MLRPHPLYTEHNGCVALVPVNWCALSRTSSNYSLCTTICEKNEKPRCTTPHISFIQEKQNPNAITHSHCVNEQFSIGWIHRLLDRNVCFHVLVTFVVYIVLVKVHRILCFAIIYSVENVHGL